MQHYILTRQSKSTKTPKN